MRPVQISRGAFLLFFIAAFLFQLRAPDTAPRPSTPEGGAWKAFEWWYAQRAYPGTLIRPSALRAAFESQRAQRQARIAGRSPSAASDSPEPTQWTSLGPRNIGGRVLAIAVHPWQTSTVFIGSASGGLWKTTTAGTGPNPWTLVQTGFPILSVGAIAIDEAHPDTMYIGTGEISRYQRPLVGTVGARASYGMGILKSTDGGASWDTTGLSWAFSAITAVQEIAINPLNPATLYAATSEGVYKSTDAGGTWALSNAEPMAMDLVLDAADTTVLVSSHGNLNSTPNPGLYRSTNAGVSWTKLAGSLPASNFGRTSLSACRSNPSVLYAGIANASNSTILGLYKSTDAGATWALRNSSNYAGSQGWYDNVVAAHPVDPATIYAAGFNVHKSSNSGTDLPAISGGHVHVDVHAITIDPFDTDVAYFGSDGGIYKTVDGGLSFVNLNNGFVTTQFYPGLANASSDSSWSFGGLQDNGTLKYTGSPNWSVVWGGDGGWCAIDPANKNTVFAETQYGRIVRSFSGGSSFGSATSGLPGSQSEWNFIPPFVVAPSDGSILYAGAKNVYKTTNQGSLWAPANGAATLNGTTISSIAVSRTSADTVLAATGSGTIGGSPLFQVFASTNGGANWANVTGSLPDRYPTDLEFDPADSRTAYITYSGYGTGHLFRTTNLGASWSPIGSGLPDLPHQCIAVDPVYSSHLYVGTDLGIYRSSDGGGSWISWSEGMPDAMILDLVVSTANDALRAATFGSGVWQRPMPRIPQLSLTYPVGNETLVTGEIERILWTQAYTSRILIEFSSDGGDSWETLEDSANAAAGYYDWTVPSVETSEGVIRISNASGGVPADSGLSPFSIVVNPDILAGWNMISVPVQTTTYFKDSLYPSSVSRAFAYEKGYDSRDTLARGVSFWLKFPAPEFTDLAGSAILIDSINVLPGWNMVGSISSPVAVADVVEDPPGLLVSNFFGYRKGYSAADTIVPGRGYWIKAASEGRMIVSSLPVSGSSAMRLAPPVEGMNSITISDATGYAQTLRFTGNSAGPALAYGEMPPPAPGGGPDVRFASGLIAEAIGSADSAPGGTPILLGGLRPPVRVSWTVAAGSAVYRIAAQGAAISLTPGTGSAILPITSGALRLSATPAGEQGVPVAFSLEQNYPNPFNPSTTIAFSLPDAGDARLSVHDALGREVGVLVEGRQPAGAHAVTWDGTGRASGIYFVRLAAAGRSAVRKMLLMK